MMHSCDPRLTPNDQALLLKSSTTWVCFQFKKKNFFFHSLGCGDSSVGKGLARQAWEPEFDILEPTF